LRSVGPQTGRTILDALAYFMVAATIIQEIQGAKAEEAIEGFPVRAGVAGEVLAIEVSEKAVAVLHGRPLEVRSKEGTSLAKLPREYTDFEQLGYHYGHTDNQ
jgi:hypothetical protein